jgi:hypothetical protein
MNPPRVVVVGQWAAGSVHFSAPCRFVLLRKLSARFQADDVNHAGVTLI